MSTIFEMILKFLLTHVKKIYKSLIENICLKIFGDVQNQNAKKKYLHTLIIFEVSTQIDKLKVCGFK